MISSNPSIPATTSRSRVRRAITLSAVVLSSACAVLSVQAQGMGGHDGRHGMVLFGGPPERVARGVDHLLDGMGATDAQRTQIKQIAQSAAADLKTQREAGRGLHEKSMQLFAAPTVDAAAAESLRQQMSAQHDLASRRMLAAMLDVSKVLTPEQRARLGERMKNREAHKHDHHQGSQRDPAPRPRP